MKIFLVVAALMSNGVWVQGPVGVVATMAKCEEVRAKLLDEKLLPTFFAGEAREYHATCVRSSPVVFEENT